MEGQNENGVAGGDETEKAPAGTSPPTREEIESLNHKLDTLISKMGAVETLLGMNSNPVLSSALNRVKLEAGLAGHAIRGADYFSSLGVRDRIAQDALEALFEKDGQNVTQITENIRRRRGSASRRIVAAKLEALERKGLVVQRPGAGRSKRFFIKKEG